MDLTEIPAGTFRRHPWEVARARFFARVLEGAGLVATPQAVLDVGAGDGYLAGTILGSLPVGSTVICFDSHYTPADLTRYGQTAHTGVSFVDRPPPARFDVLMLLDVIEHVADDRAFLTEIVGRNLAPGGSVLVSVPAWQRLFGQHDLALKHHRRYSPAACRDLLEACGLRIVRSGGLFHSLLLPRSAAVVAERLLGFLGRRPPSRRPETEWRSHAALASIVERALAADNAITHALTQRGLALPGLSFWALCAGNGDGAGESRR
jgi:SAM-dependent methyltransferase